MSKCEGRVFTMVGLFASGKSSLIDGLLQLGNNNNLTRLPVYTTRTPRNAVEAKGGSKEYYFVSDDEYLDRKQMSQKWNERIAAGVKYGIDVEDVEKNVSQGVVYLATMLPHSVTLQEQRNTFACPVFQVLIDVPCDVCQNRLLARGQDVTNRLSLQDQLDVEECLGIVDDRFVPEGISVMADVHRFYQAYAKVLKLGSV